MSNWISGIYQAGSGLEAARYGLSVVSQNMANAADPTYSRQRAEFSAVDGGSVGIHSGRGTVGGVAVTGTSRASDPVLNARVRAEDAKGGLADTVATHLAEVGQVLGEPSETGLSARLGDFWQSWGRLATSPSTATRTVVLKDAASVAATLNGMATALDGVADGAARSLVADVADVNTAATRLAEVNGQIAVGTATGGNVNTLLDERDTLLDTLSSRAGTAVTIEANGAATVTVGGASLVSGTTASVMTVDSATHAVAVAGTAVTVTAGSVAGRQSTLTTTLPKYRDMLDTVADRLASVVNSAQRGGYDAAGAAGTDVFAGSGAAGIHVVLTDPARVAAAGVAGGSLDNGVAIALSQTGLRSDSPDAAFNALVGDTASAGAIATQRASTQDTVRATVGNLKTSLSGVSYDEEAASMIAFQQSFNASSRVLTAIDAMLDTLINHTGVVGRA